MYQKEALGLEEARAAVDAVLAEASKKPEQPIAVAVVDDRGELVCFAKMNGAYPLFPHMATNKAYTAARMRRDTLNFGQRNREFNWDLETWGDSKLTDIQGGVAIIKPGTGHIPGGPSGTCIGGIGISGRTAPEDEELAFVGLRAIKL